MKNAIRLFAISAYVAGFATLMGCGEKEAHYSLLPESQTFLQSNSELSGKIDILWVIDNSGSMQTSQQNVASNFAAFISRFAAKNYDFRIAVTTSEAYRAVTHGYTAMSRYKDGNATVGPSGYRIITPDTPNIEDVFIKNISQGTGGSGDERSFFSFKAALEDPLNLAEGFPRADAFFAIVIVSDEDDFSTNLTTATTSYSSTALHTVESYADFLDAYTDTVGTERKYSVNSISILDEACRSSLENSFAGRRIGVRYHQLVEMTGGENYSLCGNFGDSLDGLSESIIDLSTTFYLAREPQIDTIRVIVNGLNVANDPYNGWVYNEELQAIQFRGSAIPSKGAKISVNFDPVTVL